MDPKETILRWWTKIKSFLTQTNLKRTSRISYHIIWNILLVFIMIGIIGAFFAFGLGAGYFASLVADEKVMTEEDMSKAVYNYEETSELYFSDNIFLSDVSTDLHREEVTLDKVSDYVKNAVIATEDEYFRTHNGIIPKAILRAVFQEVTNADTKTGGSTLTQQIIKNQILTNEVSFERKAKEILLAMRLERFFEKDAILEAYLNIVPFGRNSSGQNIAGVQTAAKGIFGKNAEELTLPQAAFIAGLPQSPSYYTPFVNGGGLKEEEGLQPGLERMKTVLERMHRENYITDEEYEEAIAYDITQDFIEPKESIRQQYPYLIEELTDRTIDILSVVLAEQDGYSKEELDNSEILHEEYKILAERALSSNGYRIHSTIDKEIYDAFQKVTREYTNFGRDKLAININSGKQIMVTNEETGEEEPLGHQPVQVGAELIENSTGRIIAFVGGRDYEISQKNYATKVRGPNGSTMKPLAAYAPAMELGYYQPGSVIADVEKHFAAYKGRAPKNFSNRYYGLVSAREAFYRSHNVSALTVYEKILPENPVERYLEKMGFEELSRERDHNDYAILSLPLGSTRSGVTVEETVNAYGTFANQGKFIDGYMIERIETNDGEVIYEHESEPVEVFSPQTSYLMYDMMRDVLTKGTGTNARAQLRNKNVDWAGKTGTSNGPQDALFMAINPNVSIGTWIGYDYNQKLDTGYNQRNTTYWAQLVNAATEIRPELMAPSEKLPRPDGIVSRSYCAVSGMLPSELCSDAGLIQSDIYNAKFVPTKKDNSLIREAYTSVNGKPMIAGEKTPAEFTEGDGWSLNPAWLKETGYDKFPKLEQLIPSDSGGWGKITIPDAETLKDDGKAPGVPTSLKNSNQKLTWKASGSNDVVGYRIYRASNPDSDNFQRIGSTTETSYTVPSGNAVYHVKAVDYFGRESSPSNKITVGDFSESKEDEKTDDNKKQEKKPDKKEEKPKPEREETSNNTPKPENEE
ncbi:penicillin-binding protein [Gracilibacillus halotolerans]|uniref:Penicillin-binding protein n=1 Tax=Gracilibacillus halotolerans TaxID=74386 RepID=A0A841RPY8_9BACI|nr:transglycosylase domain-containing protein [Gracilibacillus halotolerans]MBB6513683.1 penicillin-binding protein [Gracilibacillus halotolerans]